MVKWIYDFNEGRSKDKALLGGKGANLAEMTHLGLPVPSGFTLTTESCMRYLKDAAFFDQQLITEIQTAIERLEVKTNKSFTNDDLFIASFCKEWCCFFYAWYDGYDSQSRSK